MLSLPLEIERSIIIAKPIEEVFETIADFNSWRSWSPWLCQEPDCPVTISGEAGQSGHSQYWDGKRIGSGKILLSSFKVPSRIDYHLTFLKPWKSTSKVAFDLATTAGGTKVSWLMQGSLPLFMFFMRKMMVAMVGSDYERGLSMLKEYIETGSVASKLNIIGEVNQQAFYFVGKRCECSVKEVGPLMEKDFSELFDQVKSGQLTPGEFAFSFYHRYDLVTQNCEYTSGFAYKTQPLVNNAKLESGYIANHRALRIDHLGTYRHLGNAWSAIQGLLRFNKQKASKVVPMYEIYDSFPGQVDDKDIKTMVYIPLR